MEKFFGWRFVHLLLNRAEDNKAALYSNNIFHQTISELFENVTSCPSAACWLQDSKPGPLTKKNASIHLWSQLQQHSQHLVTTEPTLEGHRYHTEWCQSPAIYQAHERGWEVVLPTETGTEQSAVGHSAGQWQSHWTHPFPWMCQPRKQ